MQKLPCAALQRQPGEGLGCWPCHCRSLSPGCSPVPSVPPVPPATPRWPWLPSAQPGSPKGQWGHCTRALCPAGAASPSRTETALCPHTWQLRARWRGAGAADAFPGGSSFSCFLHFTFLLLLFPFFCDAQPSFKHPISLVLLLLLSLGLHLLYSGFIPPLWLCFILPFLEYFCLSLFLFISSFYRFSFFFLTLSFPISGNFIFHSLFCISQVCHPPLHCLLLVYQPFPSVCSVFCWVSQQAITWGPMARPEVLSSGMGR